MMQRLTKEEIQTLYTFTKKHFVEWYDVQTELVDHLANGIEEQWQENPNLNFGEALKNEFKKFGVFGFSEVVEQKTNALEKHYRKEVWKCLKEFFKLPKIILTSFSVWILFMAMQLFENKNSFTISIILLVFGFVFFYEIKEFKQIKRNQKETGKKWLFENVVARLGGFIHFLNIGIYIPLINGPNRQWNSVSEFVFSFCVVLYVLLYVVSIKVVSPRLKEKLSIEHPEYKLL